MTNPASLESIAADLIGKAKANEDLADPKQYRHPEEFRANCLASASAYRRAAEIILMQIECEA